MGQQTGPRLFVCVLCMQLAAAVAMVAADTAATAHDRHLLDMGVLQPATASFDVAALAYSDAILAAATSVVQTPNITAQGLVAPAKVADNAASEWLGGDLPPAPPYVLLGCFQDGTSFYKPRRLARRLAVSRGRDLPPGALG